MKKDFLNTCLDDYFRLICVRDQNSNSSRLEALFLMTMSELEKMAGDQILANRSSRTPRHLLSDIQSHADDEYRHSQQLKAMAEEVLAGSELTLSEKQKLAQMVSVAKSFVTGYFGNAELTQAASKHVAYVHGALTIEQFPFQVYSAYLRKTQIPLVRERLPTIIADEQRHLQFGHRMRSELPQESLMDLTKLHQVEKKMCGFLFTRLQRIQKGDCQESDQFCSRINTDMALTSAWVQTLGYAEERAAVATSKFFSEDPNEQPDLMKDHLSDEVRHQKILHRAILLQRRKFRHDPKFQEMERTMTARLFHYQNKIFAFLKRTLTSPQLIYFYATSMIESRVFKHYTDLVQSSNDILVTYALNEILQDEIEHAMLFHKALKSHPGFDPEFLKSLKTYEAQCFQEMNRAVLKDLEQRVCA